MRFHHSTRRGRKRLNQHSGQHSTGQRLGAHQALSSRWSKLTYCRETNIHFNRRLPVEPPVELCGGEGDIDQQLVELEQVLLEEDRLRQCQASDELQLRSPGRNRTPNDQRAKTSQIDEKLNQLHLVEMPKEKVRTAMKSDLKGKETNRAGRNQPDIQPNSNQQIKADKSSDIDMEAARQKLVAQVEKHPFWSNKAAKRMHLTQVESRKIYILELISFCERRDLEWCYEPYKGGLAGSSIPFRRRDSTGGSPSATGTPFQQDLTYFTAPQYPTNTPSYLRGAGFLQRTIEVPRPLVSSELQGNSVNPSSPGTDSHLNAKIDLQGGDHLISTTRAAGSKSPVGGTIYEPVSGIDRPMPSQKLIWSVEAPAHLKPQPFSGYAHSSELPNSSFVKRCHGCSGRGRIKCASCYGVGYEVCLSCSGKGTTRSSGGGGGALSSRSSGRGGDSSRTSAYANEHDHDDSNSDGRGRYNDTGGSSGGSAWVTESCHFCHGAGQKRCWVCAGKSFNHCLGCTGAGKLRCYLNLNITWMNHRDEVILNNSDNIIPRERLRLCSGLLLTDKIEDRLHPLDLQRLDSVIGCAQETTQIHTAARRLLAKHYQNYRGEMLIKQRYRLTQIQCHVVGYEWKRRRGHFVIYGKEKKVYIAKYPFKSICSIT